MTATDDPSVIAQRVKKIVESVKEPLGLNDIFYGDQFKIPRNNTVCVVADTVRTELVNSPRGVNNSFTTRVIVYHCKVEDSAEGAFECDQLAQNIKTAINFYDKLQDPDAPDPSEVLVYHSYVTSTEPGYAVRERTKWKTHRITVESQSQTRLPTLGM